MYQHLKQRKFQGIEPEDIKKISLQVLQALKLLDRCKIIHCDLKPENILIKSDLDSIKVIDLGSACSTEGRMYTYIQSRFYRAPEVILGINYSNAVDMWSFGCILVELLTGRPIFAGENETDQLLSIIEVIGLPPARMVKRASRKNVFFDSESRLKNISYKGKRRIPDSKSLRDILSGADERMIDIVQQCFEWDQTKRITPDEALLHPWFQENATKSRLKHIKAQSESLFKLCKLFTIKESTK